MIGRKSSPNAVRVGMLAANIAHKPVGHAGQAGEFGQFIALRLGCPIDEMEGPPDRPVGSALLNQVERIAGPSGSRLDYAKEHAAAAARDNRLYHTLAAQMTLDRGAGLAGLREFDDGGAEPEPVAYVERGLVDTVHEEVFAHATRPRERGQIAELLP